ncbi:MT-A70-domain-containing protein [Dichomitus squalens]|uniref:MT-A70-domain-containing protein n=1 Tax=Dichomitus squalens TaxID=114155 RepID=A0A4Q9MG27_9APHY|nr:MT-A70-domain-containing protein [Dichomitus squalens]
MSVTTTECLASANELLATHNALVSRLRNTQRNFRRQLKTLPSPPNVILKLPLIPTPPRSPSPSPPSSPLLVPVPKPHRPDLPPAKRARLARYSNYVPEEETIRNDYSQRYVDGGEWPQNWVLGADPEHRFEEYPKQQRLLALKKAAVAAHAIPPTFLPYSELSSLQGSKFDVILIDPPFSSSFTWDDLQDLPIPALSADPSFVLLWVGSGSGEGLERGREVMAKWGFRRCEDIVWVKTNKTSNKGPGTDPPTTSLLTRTKQHCLMGIRGTVRRSTDSWFVHCNVDTDVLIWEGDSSDPTLKPPEMYTLIENFCLGLRRLEIFGRARTARRGWVTALAEGEEVRIEEGMTLGDEEGQEGAMRWNRETWEARIKDLAGRGQKLVVPVTADIDALRPKSPVRGGSTNAGASMMNSAMSAGSPMQMTLSMAGSGGAAGGGGGRGGGGGFGNQGRGVMGPPAMLPTNSMNTMGGGMGGMGIMGGWGGDMGMPGLGINVGMGGMGMGGMSSMGGPMGGMNAMGMAGMGQQGMGFGGGGGGHGGGRFGGGGFDGNMGMGMGGMGWMGNGEGFSRRVHGLSLPRTWQLLCLRSEPGCNTMDYVFLIVTCAAVALSTVPSIHFILYFSHLPASLWIDA